MPLPALRSLALIVLATLGDARVIQTRPVPASDCQRLAPNYIGSVGVSAWEARRRAAGVNVWIDPAMARIIDVGGTSLRGRLAARLSRWATPNVPRVRAIVTNVEDADIRFTYGLTPSRGGIDGITHRTLVDGSFTTGAQIQLNTLASMGFHFDSAGDPALLDSVAAAALHEFGHALGIHGHSPSKRDLMFHDGSGEACGAGCGPTAADKNTLTYLACRAIENGSGWAID